MQSLINLPTVRSDEAASCVAADLSEALCCLDCNRLVSCVDELNVSVRAAHQKCIKMTAMKSKNGADAQLMETLC